MNPITYSVPENGKNNANPHAPLGLQPVDRFIRLPEVQQITGMGKTCIYSGIKTGAFPKQYKLSVKSSAWRLSEIVAWMDSRQQDTIGGAA